MMRKETTRFIELDDIDMDKIIRRMVDTGVLELKVRDAVIENVRGLEKTAKEVYRHREQRAKNEAEEAAIKLRIIKKLLED